jgi:hypothetical protein
MCWQLHRIRSRQFVHNTSAKGLGPRCGSNVVISLSYFGRSATGQLYVAARGKPSSMHSDIPSTSIPVWCTSVCIDFHFQALTMVCIAHITTSLSLSPSLHALPGAQSKNTSRSSCWKASLSAITTGPCSTILPHTCTRFTSGITFSPR